MEMGRAHSKKGRQQQQMDKGKGEEDNMLNLTIQMPVFEAAIRNTWSFKKKGGTFTMDAKRVLIEYLTLYRT